MQSLCWNDRHVPGKLVETARMMSCSLEISMATADSDLPAGESMTRFSRDISHTLSESYVREKTHDVHVSSFSISGGSTGNRCQ